MAKENNGASKWKHKLQKIKKGVEVEQENSKVVMYKRCVYVCACACVCVRVCAVCLCVCMSERRMVTPNK